jgi:co-chaperonin GroES (HSP10)
MTPEWCDLYGQDLKPTKDFVLTLSSLFYDQKLSVDEKKELIELQRSYQNQCDDVSKNTRTNLIDTWTEIKNEIKKSDLYNSYQNELNWVKKTRISELQWLIWAPRDWYFWPITFMNFVNSPYYKAELEIYMLANWAIINEWNKEEYNRKLAVMTWGEDSETYTSIELKAWDVFYFDEKNWNIIIYSAYKSEKYIISIDDTILWNIKNILDSWDKEWFRNLFNWLSDAYAMIYISSLKRYINNNEKWEEARSIFVNYFWNWEYRIDLYNRILNREITASDIFWDKEKLTKNWIIYLNNHNWDFYSVAWRRLSISSWDRVSVLEKELEQEQDQEQSEKQQEQDQESLIESNETISEIQREFWNWLTNNARKNLVWWSSNCWLWTMTLVKIFLKQKFWNFTFYTWQRNWRNIDTMLTWKMNWKLIYESGRNIKETDDIEQFWSWTWEDIEKIVDGLPVKFELVEINTPYDAESWDICIYNEIAWNSTRQRLWHAEIKWSDWLFYSHIVSHEPWWSIKIPENEAKKNPDNYKKRTWFVWVIRMSKKV